MEFVFAWCAGCGHPIRQAADARPLDNNYYCAACYELERRRPFVQLNLFPEGTK